MPGEHLTETLVSWDQGTSYTHLWFAHPIPGTPTHVVGGRLLGTGQFVRASDNRSFAAVHGDDMWQKVTHLAGTSGGSMFGSAFLHSPKFHQKVVDTSYDLKTTTDKYVKDNYLAGNDALYKKEKRLKFSDKLPCEQNFNCAKESLARVIWPGNFGKLMEPLFKWSTLNFWAYNVVFYFIQRAREAGQG